MDTTAPVRFSVIGAFLKWRVQHKKLYFNLFTGWMMFIGSLPAIIVFLTRWMIESHIGLSFWANVVLLVGGYALLVFGALLGALVSYTCFIVHKICFPENIGTSQP